MKLDLPVLLLGLPVAAAAQDLLPGMPGSPLKVPFLLALVVCCALERPLIMAAIAALWAGWLTDGAGGLTNSCTSAFLLLLTLLLRLLRRALAGSFAGLVAACTVAALAQALWQMGWSRLALPDGGWRMAGDLALLLPSGAVAGATVSLLFRTFSL